MTDRIVLACSGGLDTSVAIGWIAEETGEAIHQRALDCGAAQAVVADVRDEYANPTVSGRRSGSSLSDFDLATYDAGDTFDHSLAKGSGELWGVPSKTAARRDQRTGDARTGGGQGTSAPRPAL